MEEKQNKLKKIMNLDLKDIKKELINRNKEKKRVQKKDNKKEIVSFDINEEFINIVVGKFHKDTLTISKCIQIETPKGTIDDGKIINEELLVNELKSTLDKNKIKVKYGSFTTNSTLIINREMVIPEVKEDEIETVISFEISQYLPINLNDYILQTLTLDSIELDGAKKLKVHTICYPEKIAKSYYNVLKRLNIKPYSLDIKFNSLNKLINYSQEINNEDYDIKNSNIFIEIGPKHTEINIYKNGEIDFTRIIRVGYRDLEEEPYIIDSYKVDYLIEEIQRILQFYKNKFKNNIISKIYLLGEGSKIENIDIYMSNKLEINTETIKSIGFIESTSKNIVQEDMYKYINSIGTIIRL